MKIALSVLMLVCGGAVFAQGYGIDPDLLPAGTAVVDSVLTTNSASSSSIGGVIGLVFYSALFLTCIGLGVYANYTFFREKKRAYTELIVAEMQEKRSAGGSYPEVSQANEECIKLCAEILKKPRMTTSFGDIILTSREDVDGAFDVIKKCKELAPTSETAIGKLNEVGALANLSQKRLTISHIYSCYMRLSRAEKIIHVILLAQYSLFLFVMIVASPLSLIFIIAFFFSLWLIFRTPNYIADNTFQAKYFALSRWVSRKAGGGFVNSFDGTGIAETYTVVLPSGRVAKATGTDADSVLFFLAIRLALALSFMGLLYISTPIFFVIAGIRNYITYK